MAQFLGSLDHARRRAEISGRRFRARDPVRGVRFDEPQLIRGYPLRTIEGYQPISVLAPN